MKRIPLYIGLRHNPQVIRIVKEMTADGATEREIHEHLEARCTDRVGSRTVMNIRRRHNLRVPAVRPVDEVVVDRLASAQPVVVRRLQRHQLAPELAEAIRILAGYGMSSTEIHARIHPHMTLIGLRRWMNRHRDEIRGVA